MVGHLFGPPPQIYPLPHPILLNPPPKLPPLNHHPWDPHAHPSHPLTSTLSPTATPMPHIYISSLVSGGWGDRLATSRDGEWPLGGEGGVWPSALWARIGVETSFKSWRFMTGKFFFWRIWKRMMPDVKWRWRSDAWRVDKNISVSDPDPDSGVFWIRIRIRNPDPGA